MVLVRNVEELPTQDYVLRKLEVTHLDRVGKALLYFVSADPLTWGQIISYVTCTHTHNPLTCASAQRNNKSKDQEGKKQN